MTILGVILGSDQDILRAASDSLGFRFKLVFATHWNAYNNGTYTGVLGKTHHKETIAALGHVVIAKEARLPSK